jgi:hypothetical protein
VSLAVGPLIAPAAHAQGPQLLFGKVLRKNTHEVLGAVTVHDISGNHFDQSDMGGNYRVSVRPGDTVIFSYTGYRPDTVRVDAMILADRYEVYLTPDVRQLTTIRLGDLNAYQVDSMQRREDYSMFYESKPTPVIENHNVYDGGFGLRFHPFSYFDKKAVQRRKLKKRLDQEEKDDYINYKFSRTFVTRLTGLDGDSLELFMDRYRPSYDFCRKASQQDMLLYVNDRFKDFEHGGKKSKA